MTLEVRSLEREEMESLWSIDRSETIERVFVCRDEGLVLQAEHHDVEGWPEGEPEEYRPRLLDCFDRGGPCLGAFRAGRLVAAVVLEAEFIGPARDRLQLKFLHVGRAERGSGLGKALFRLAADEAGRRGARALYISATPSERTIRFYLDRGCVLAKALDPDLFALEPEDIHLEYPIPE